VELLLKYGANVLAQDYLGQSALHMALQDENLELIIILLRSGGFKLLCHVDDHAGFAGERDDSLGNESGESQS
jgi:ankyrin repeat protein